MVTGAFLHLQIHIWIWGHSSAFIFVDVNKMDMLLFMSLFVFNHFHVTLSNIAIFPNYDGFHIYTLESAELSILFIILICFIL